MRSLLLKFLPFLFAFVFAVSGHTVSAAGCLEAGPDGEDYCGGPPISSEDSATESETEADASTELFLLPDSAEDTLFGNRWYGRLADFTDIYPEPSFGVAPTRNSDDGFVYVTILQRLQNDVGETWYQINYNEFVHEDNLTTSKVSEFQGVQLSRQPERPFAWVVQGIRPSSEPDGEPNPDFEQIERYDLVQIYDSVLGEDDWFWYDIGDGRWVRQTQFGVVNVTERPEDIGEDEFWTEVDIYEQVFKAYEGDRLVFATLISTGLNRWPTNTGLYQVADRLKEWKMSGSQGFPDYYHLEDIPYIMYFNMNRGIALHGTYWHDRFGYKHSHGCVNMAVQDAEWAFTWSEDAPNELWVYVHNTDAFGEPITSSN